MHERRANLTIKGKVQGVFYRQSALQKAKDLGLTGFVRNMPSGEVEATVEGAAVPVQEFIAWCQKGPPAARVLEVRVLDATPTGEFSDFVVERSS